MKTISCIFKKALGILALLGLTFIAMPNLGRSQSLKKVVIGYSGISPSQAPAWVAYDQGFFRKYGLDVDLIFIEGGSRTVQTLISGDVIAAQVAGSSVLQSNLQGSGVVLVG